MLSMGGRLQLSRLGEHLLGVGERFLGGVARKEAGDFGDPLGTLNAQQTRLGDVLGIIATDHVVDGALHREMCIRDRPVPSGSVVTCPRAYSAG